MIPSYEWHVMMEVMRIVTITEQRSFQTQLRGVDKQAPCVWIMLLAKSSNDRVHIVTLH